MTNFPELPFELQQKILKRCIDFRLITFENIPMLSLGENDDTGLGLVRRSSESEAAEAEVRKLVAVATVSKGCMKALLGFLEAALRKRLAGHHTHDEAERAVRQLKYWSWW